MAVLLVELIWWSTAARDKWLKPAFFRRGDKPALCVPVSEVNRANNEGRAVMVDQDVELVQPFMEAARERREEHLGIVVTESIETVYENEAALGIIGGPDAARTWG